MNLVRAYQGLMCAGYWPLAWKNCTVTMGVFLVLLGLQNLVV